MKATIKYTSSFTIPRALPHAGPGPEDETDDRNDDIFFDYVYVGEKDLLILSSLHGQTSFQSWREEDDRFVVDGTASFEGAFHAMNSVHGVEFPESEVTKIESTIGHFETLEDYQFARSTILPMMRHLQRFLRAKRSSIPMKEKQAKDWLATFENAAGSVLDMSDSCRNPIHSDGSTGYLA